MTEFMKSNPIARLGDTGLYVLTDLGRMAIFLLHAFRGIFRRPFRLKELVSQVHFIGAGSLVVDIFHGPVDWNGAGLAGILFTE